MAFGLEFDRGLGRKVVLDNKIVVAAPPRHRDRVKLGGLGW